MSEQEEVTDSAIICATNQSLKSVLRDGVRRAGIAATMILDKTSDTVRELKSQPKCWLLLDHKIPGTDLVKILSAAQGDSGLTTRPIYLVTSDFKPEIVTMALEFNISKVRFGDINAGGIETDLQEIHQKHKKNFSILESLATARHLIEQKKYQDAGDIFRSLLKNHGTNTSLNIEYIDFLLLTNDLDLAKKQIEEAQLLEPNDIRFQQLQARYYMRVKNYEEGARILLTLESSAKPCSLARLVDLGNALLTTSRFKEAKERFEKALAIDPSNQDARSGQAQAVLLEGNLKDGLELLRDLGSTRQVASTLNAAAVCASRSGRFEEARSLYENGIKLLLEDRDSSARIWYNLGILEHRAENHDAAERCFINAVKADPKFKEAKSNLQILRRQLGKPEVSAPTSRKQMTSMKTIDIPTSSSTSEKSKK